jgi:hypothetical protein
MLDRIYTAAEGRTDKCVNLNDFLTELGIDADTAYDLVNNALSRGD